MLSENETNKESINVLLISMSILPNTLIESYYEFPPKDGEDAYFFRGISQMEAGTKYFLRMLQRNGKKLDKIIIVESYKSRKEQYKVTGLIETGEEENVKTKEMSSVDFYKERIRQYIQGKENPHIHIYKPNGRLTQEECDNKNCNLKKLHKQVWSYENGDGQEISPLEQLNYNDVELRDFFVDVELSDDKDRYGESMAIYGAIRELCDNIQKLNNILSVILYTDMQGARRNETFIINAALRMLKMRDIDVEKSIAIDYASDTNSQGGFNFIVDTTINDRIFEMVSGMNEFQKTGRGDTLINFWENSNELLDISEEEKHREANIIEQIKEISDGISLCYVDKFEEGLKKFKDDVKEYQKALDMNESDTHPLFATFVTDLQKEYSSAGLLNNPIKLENQVKWCKKKGLYQQALTLIEAKAPEELVKDKLINGNHPQGGNVCYKNMDTLKQLLHFAYTHNYQNNSYEDQGNDNKNRSLLGKFGVPSYAFDHNYAVHPAYVFINYAIYWRKCNSRDQYIISLFGKHWSRDKGITRTFPANDLRIKLGKFLEEYNVVKELRNKINHAESGTILEDESNNNISVNEHHNDTLIVNNNTSGNTEESSVTDSLKATIIKTIDDFFESYNALANIQIDFSRNYPLSTWQNQ